MYKTINAVREAFWQSTTDENRKERRTRKRQNDYYTDIRCEFVDFVDYLARNGQISEKLAYKVTL